MFQWLTKLGTSTPQRPVPVALPMGAERRRAVRYSCDLQVNDRLVVSIGTSSWPAVVADISTTGIGLVVGVRHDPGTTLPIDLYCTASGYARSLRVRVVRTQRMADGHWFCGCRFDEQLQHEELNQLL
jgi:hypothetical protein